MFAALIVSGMIDPADDDANAAATEPEPILPREIPRSSVTMLDAIGEGNFGEVWKGILDERHHGGAPAFTVSVETRACLLFSRVGFSMLGLSVHEVKVCGYRFRADTRAHHCYERCMARYSMARTAWLVLHAAIALRAPHHCDDC